MINFLNRRKKEVTFKKKVADFWNWFEKNADYLYKSVKQGNSLELTDETIRQVDKLMPGLAWCYGPGKDKSKFSFTLSPEANRSFQFLTRFWLDKAKEIPNWEFYCARQPSSDPSGHAITIGERSFEIKEMWLKPEIDNETRMVNISVWHPHFGEMGENDRFQILFLWLDEVLGETGTEQWVGQVDFSTEEFEEAIPMLELSKYVENLKEKNGWTKPPPEECYSLYEIEPGKGIFKRSDVKFGNTCHMQLIGEYYETQGNMPNVLSGSHAEFVFISFPSTVLPEGEEIEKRNEIEKYINQILQENSTGRSIGSAFGINHNYLDFILFDGDESLEILLNAMNGAGLPAGSEIHYWTSENTDSFSL